MTGATRRPDSHGADSWWVDDTGTVDLDATAPVVAPRRRRAPVKVGIVPRILTVLLAPLRLVLRLMDRSPALRRVGVRIAIVLSILCIIGGAVGVILANNLVISRTAELGELDDRRRELRRENALMSAERAQLGAAPKIVKRAETRLGMTQISPMPKYIFMDPNSRELTDLQRRRLAAATRKRAERLQAQRSKADAADAATDKELTK